jgi:hypothetical protein
VNAVALGLTSLDLLYEGLNYVLRIKPRINDITANTIKICIKPPALYTKKPNSQPIINITAIRYSILLMVNKFFRLRNMRYLIKIYCHLSLWRMVENSQHYTDFM